MLERNTEKPPPRRVRSFVRREGRLTEGQRRNLEALWPRFGVDMPGSAVDWPTLFGRNAPLTLEIGFGAGEVLAQLAGEHPDRNFLGIEAYRNGVGRLLGRVQAAGLDNLRVLEGDAVELLDHGFADASLDTLLLYFPDPWPKKKHHKRRLVQTAFADRVARVLKPGGLWRLATDWVQYAEWMREVLDDHPAFDNIGDRDGWVTRPPRPGTRFESRGLRRGHAVHDLAYRRRD
jgi:tRNA (guanine-N7-)-methyltransferase